MTWNVAMSRRQFQAFEFRRSLWIACVNRRNRAAIRAAALMEWAGIVLQAIAYFARIYPSKCVKG